ncbi:MAG: hypothetical protein AAGH79_11940 [Bacteroidota bacterium]
MQRINTTTATLIAAFVLFLATACQKDKVIELTEGVVFNVNTDILLSPLTISFENALETSIAVPNNVQIDISGPGIDDIYTLAGEKNIQAVDGVINIGIKKNREPSLENPIEFTITSKANGYLTTINQFSITDGNKQTHSVIYMAEKNALPNGVVSLEESLSVNEEGLQEPISISAIGGSGEEEQMNVDIEESTIFYDADGYPVTGNLRLDLIQYNAMDEDAMLTVENMLSGFPAINGSGTELGDVTFEVAAYYSLDIFSSSKEVRTFSKPLQMRIVLDPETFNPNTNTKIQAGDALPIWSLNEELLRWENEGAAIVIEENGQLIVEYEQEHLSNWVIGGANNTCSIGATLVFNTDVPANYCSRYFYVKLINEETGLPVSNKAFDYLDLADGTEVTLVEAPLNVSAYLEIYSGVKGCEGQLLETTDPFEVCGATINLQIEDIDKDDWYPIEVSVSGYCENAGPDLSVGPTGNILYRPTECGSYGILGRMVNGQGCTGTLEYGVSYDFKVRYGSEVFEYIGLTIENRTIEYTLDNGQNVEVVVIGGANNAELVFEEIPIPADYCYLLEQ